MEEIEKMSNEELLSEYSEYSDTTQWDYAKDKRKFEETERLIKEELLKRLSKNNIAYTSITPAQAVEEFKKRLIEEISKKLNNEFNGIGENVRLKEIIDLINNIEKE